MLNEILEFEAYAKSPESEKPRIQPKLLTNNFSEDGNLFGIERILIVIARGYIFSKCHQNEIYNSDGMVNNELLNDARVILQRWCGFEFDEPGLQINRQSISNWFEKYPEADGWLKKYWMFHCAKKTKKEKMWNTIEKQWGESLMEKDYAEDHITLDSVIANSRAILKYLMDYSNGVGKGTVIQQLLTEYPEKYVVSVSATTRKPRKGEVDGKSYYFKKREEFEDLINKNEFLEFAEYAGEYYGTLKKDVYKNYFKGKNVIIEIDSQGARQIREKQKIQSVFLIPPSFEELLHRLKNRGTESKESIHRRLKQALDEIEHIEEYGVLLVNDSVEGTAFVIDALFHPGLKNASGMNERELKIAREIREGIIKYLSDEEDE